MVSVFSWCPHPRITPTLVQMELWLAVSAQTPSMAVEMDLPLVTRKWSLWDMSSWGPLWEEHKESVHWDCSSCTLPKQRTPVTWTEIPVSSGIFSSQKKKKLMASYLTCPVSFSRRVSTAPAYLWEGVNSYSGSHARFLSRVIPSPTNSFPLKDSSALLGDPAYFLSFYSGR